MRPAHPCPKRLPSPPQRRQATADLGMEAAPRSTAAATAGANTAVGGTAVAVAVSWATFSIETSGPALRFGNPWRTVSTNHIMAFSRPREPRPFGQ